jgi:peptidoglycan-associated lipoprotein
MKMIKLTYLLTCAVAITLAVTGCRNHRPVEVTRLQGTGTGQIGDLGPGGTVGSDQTQVGGGAMADIESINGMAADRSALSAQTVYFAYDSSAIRSSERSKIEAVASALRSDPGTKLMIEGNCDERGTEEYNRALGERRALAVRQALVRMGISSSRVFTKSYGKDNPLNDPGHDESAWSKNRRDDFVLLHPRTGV